MIHNQSVLVLGLVYNFWLPIGSQEEPEAGRQILPESQPAAEVLGPMAETEAFSNIPAIRILDTTSRLHYFGPEANEASKAYRTDLSYRGCVGQSCPAGRKHEFPSCSKPLPH